MLLNSIPTLLWLCNVLEKCLTGIARFFIYLNVGEIF